VAIICVHEVHWENLLKLMDRGDLKDDPRFVDQATRGENSRLVDSVVQAWTCALSKGQVSERLRAHQIPGAAVRQLGEVIEDAHMHERGMLHRMDHPEFGPVVLPHSPLRFHGEERVALIPSPNLGQHSREVLADWLDYDEARVDDLIKSGAVGEQAV
jgi:formyl-CoA transferase